MDVTRSAVVTAFLLGASLCVVGQTPAAPAHQNAVATVAGEPIFATELDSALQSVLWQLHAQEYDLRKGTLELLINQKLLELEAAKRGIPAEKLLRDEVEAKVAEPTDGEVEAYYLGQKNRQNRPPAEVRTQIQQALKQARIEEASRRYYKDLRDHSQVAVLLRRPQMDPDPKRLRGSPDAPVAIIEFSDLQCPYCQMIQPILRQVLQKYGDRVNLSFRDMPLDQLHPTARKAAEAARCAAEQGKFWDYQDALFSSGKLSEKDLADHAHAVGLDGQAFDTCLASGKFKEQVENDRQMGLRAGVTGTPAFFVNGTVLQGSQPLEAFVKIIDAELATAGPERAAQSSPAK